MELAEQSSRPPAREAFEVVIVSDISVEFNTLKALFDHVWDATEYKEALDGLGDYTLGRIGTCNVVLALAPPSFATSSRAVFAEGIKSSFPRVQLGLVVGVCGAIPKLDEDEKSIALGDVIISTSLVHQAFRGRHLLDEAVVKDTLLYNLSRPNVGIRAFVAMLAGLYVRVRLRICFLSHLLKLSHTEVRDMLEGSATTNITPEGATHTQKPDVHFGPILSTDVVTKSAQHRDEIARKAGVIAFGVETAAVWLPFPTIIIKGVCDYVDENKRDGWLQYAASSAASCTKALLDMWCDWSAHLDDIQAENIVNKTGDISDTSEVQRAWAGEDALRQIHTNSTESLELHPSLLDRDYDVEDRQPQPYKVGDLEHVIKYIATGVSNVSPPLRKRRVNRALDDNVSVELRNSSYLEPSSVSESIGNGLFSEKDLESTEPTDLDSNIWEEETNLTNLKGISFDEDTKSLASYSNLAAGDEKAFAIERYLEIQFAGLEELESLVVEALNKMSRQKLAENFQKLLKAFYIDLRTDAQDALQYNAVRIFRGRRARDRIAQRIIDLVQPEDAQQRAQLEEENRETVNHMKDVGAWMSNINVYIRGFRDKIPDTEDSDSDSEVSREELSTFAEVEQFLLKGAPFEKMIMNFRAFLLQTHQMSLTRILKSIPTDQVWFAEGEDNSFINSAKGYLEDLTGTTWNWWPFRPRMRRLAVDEIRVHWICHCGTHLWHEISKQEARAMKLILHGQRTRVEDQHFHLCKHLGIKRNSNFLGFNPIKFITYATGSRSATAQGNSAPKPAKSTSTSHDDTKTKQSHDDQISNTGIGNATNAEVSLKIDESSRDRWTVFLGVPGGRTTLELAQIDVADCGDLKFFGELRREFNTGRGLWNRILSVSRYSHCDFVKFQKFRRSRVIPKSFGLPVDQAYRYNPRPPDAEIPPITRHEFNMAFYPCNDSCWLRFLPFHECFEPVTDLKALERIPKRANPLELNTNTAEIFWGLEARLEPSLSRIIILHMVIFAGPIAFWAWWQRDHPNDLSTAVVPLATLVSLLSLFWGAVAVLKVFQDERNKQK